MGTCYLLKKKKDKNIENFDLIIDLQKKFRNSLILKIFLIRYFTQEHLIVFFHENKKFFDDELKI